MTRKSLALAMVMAGSLASTTVFGQTVQSNLVTPQIAAPRAEGQATHTTDHVGLTNKPAAVANTKRDPKHVPGWHIPLPHIHRGR
jgi:hypothetical protein